MLNYYDKKDLLLYATDKGKKRLFTAEQIFWLCILNDIAKLGYTLTGSIQAIRYKFENTEVMDCNVEVFHLLQFMLANIIHPEQEYHLKIDEDGSHTFFT